LVDLARARGLEPPLGDGKSWLLKTKKTSEHLREAQNFFKDGAKDPKEKFSF
jgi:hypothetical protein